MTRMAAPDALRSKLNVARPAVAMSAHNPLAAKLAAMAGFDVIWGSGFELSASYAVPDASILSADTHLEMMRAIAAAQDAPVLADIDTGFGNAVTVAYMVPRYVSAGVAGVVMEDKTFPKDSSLRQDGRQELVRIEEFQGKIEAARTAGCVVIARTEALIAGLGQPEALRRGAAYAEAGADAILIHSKQTTPDEIIAFCKAWPGVVPLVLVPTSYPQLSFADITRAEESRADHLWQSRHPRRGRGHARYVSPYPGRRWHRRGGEQHYAGRRDLRFSGRCRHARSGEALPALIHPRFRTIGRRAKTG